jgi:hypothetical protein
VLGAAVNTAFVDRFQVLAKGPFVVRRLERAYGKGVNRWEYDCIRAAEASLQN